MTLERGAVLLVLDGLRPDFVTPRLMPNLDALAQRGVRYTRSHAVWPTVTRVNASSIATGCYPATHGIPDNQLVARDLDPTLVLDAGSHEDLARLREVRDGRVLRRPTLAERVSAAGGSSAVVGTGSPGSSQLHHPDADAHGDAVHNQAFWLGVERAEVEADLGAPMPEGTAPNVQQNRWFMRLVTERLLPGGADYVVFWHCDPDKTQHRHAVGHPRAIEALREADRNVGRLVASLEELALSERYDLIVTSDHGFSTNVPALGEPKVREALAATGFAPSEAVVAGSGIYLDDPERAASAAAVLRALDGIGAVFTGARGAPVVEGTLPLAAVGQGGEDGADLVFSQAWSDDENEHGWRGLRAGGTRPASNHGSASPWEIRNTLILAGPSFAEGVVSDVPAGNVDLAPTLAHVLGVAGDEMDGRVLHEALRDGPAPEDVEVAEDVIESAKVSGQRQVMQRSRVDGVSYLDGALTG